MESALGNVRRSLSWRKKTPPPKTDPAVLRREEVEKAFSDVFAGVIFRGSGEKSKGPKERRKRMILEALLQTGRDG